MRPQSTRSRQQFVKLCACGCGQPTLLASVTRDDRGHVRGQPLRYLPDHFGRKSDQEYIIDGRGCWVWQLSMNGGYGQKSADGKLKRAHVVYYERHVGPVPDGLLLDHTCRNRACVNPSHLEAVTFTENMRRAKNTKLTIETARAIRALAGTMSHRAIARRFGVDASSITRIMTGQYWREGPA